MAKLYFVLQLFTIVYTLRFPHNLQNSTPVSKTPPQICTTMSASPFLQNITNSDL